MTSKFSVGLTGGIGSGKSTVADMFADRGATVIDTDVIAHQLTVSGGISIPSIRAEFGDVFIDLSGAMDRAKMRAQVFADPTAKTRLEAILHPLIRQESERAANAAQGAYVMFVVPLLVESNHWRQRVSRVLVVDCPEEQQIERVMARNGMNREQVLAIMATQSSREQRLASADDVISNDGTTNALTPQIDSLHALYLRLTKETRTI
jgi:dephospho-CoA kinase